MPLRLYDPTGGAVRLGGVDLRDADPVSLRQRVAIVTQDVQLFATSVRDNLTMFRPGLADDARLRSVLDEGGLGRWLRGLPDGLDTALGPLGGGVSAGEGQLLAFARAFLTDPGLVVLDEAARQHGWTPEETTVAIQGYGNVGSWTAKLAAANGYRVVAVSDVNGGIHVESGIDIELLDKHVGEAGTVVGFDGAEAIDNPELLALD